MRKHIVKKLLSGTHFLKNPQFNKEDLTQDERLLRVCLMAYLNGSGIEAGRDFTLNEVQDAMHCEICNAIGDTAFVDWSERMSGPEVES